jgi:hypothetical protein
LDSGESILRDRLSIFYPFRNDIILLILIKEVVMKLEEMKVRIEEMMDELAERNFTCLNDGFNYNQLSAMFNIVEAQLSGKVNAGYDKKYGRIWYATYPHAREEVLRFFPGWIEAYEREI